MKWFTDCSGECCICVNGDFCLAGHGDDDYWPANKEQIIKRLNDGQYKSHTHIMINYLLTHYNYTYAK